MREELDGTFKSKQLSHTSKWWATIIVDCFIKWKPFVSLGRVPSKELLAETGIQELWFRSSRIEKRQR